MLGVNLGQAGGRGLVGDVRGQELDCHRPGHAVEVEDAGFSQVETSPGRGGSHNGGFCIFDL